MGRKRDLQCRCLICLGLGMLIGSWIDSGFVSCVGGLGLIFLGISGFRRR